MIKQLQIENFKSIQKQAIDLDRVNVFIGENGSGKSNILEAVGMLAAAKSEGLSVESLFFRGVRVARPSLTFNSFLGLQQKKQIRISLQIDGDEVLGQLSCSDPNDINSTWIDEGKNKARDIIIDEIKELLSAALKEEIVKQLKPKNSKSRMTFTEVNEFVTDYLKQVDLEKRAEPLVDAKAATDLLAHYVIYNFATNALRGISNESKRTPLGINGEGLDLLLTTLNEEQFEELHQYTQYISWLQDIKIDSDDSFKSGGYKLGRSTSNLYFTDRFMLKKNNMFAAENANEGALHFLAYLALLISPKTPSFFAIDNIETALNPKLCRDIMRTITILAPKFNKQVLITTHNPAILDGLDLHDPQQRLFVVKRTDEGFTKVDRIQNKPSVDGHKYKLSEMWMRGYLGALPSYQF